MEKVESIRERLLSRLPQTEDIAAYKEEVAVLLAKHERALYWDGLAPKLGGAVAVIVFLLSWWVGMEQRYLVGLACIAILGAGFASARYDIVKGQLELLKEIKQLQLQVLELQTSMRKSDDA